MLSNVTTGKIQYPPIHWPCPKLDICYANEQNLPSLGLKLLFTVLHSYSNHGEVSIPGKLLSDGSRPQGFPMVWQVFDVARCKWRHFWVHVVSRENTFVVRTRAHHGFDILYIEAYIHSALNFPKSQAGPTKQSSNVSYVYFDVQNAPAICSCRCNNASVGKVSNGLCIATPSMHRLLDSPSYQSYRPLHPFGICPL